MGNAESTSRHCRATSVHPHARGERIHAGRKNSDAAGSSPRAWGTLVRRHLAQVFERFIPTRVGNARWKKLRWQVVTVHPHARGERATADKETRMSDGSSPRAWGTRRAPGDHHDLDRFIPTRVGNAPARGSSGVSGSVHPHARGERFRRWCDHNGERGSSPRAWGTLRMAPRRRNPPRFIPTRVGNAPRLRPGLLVCPVHPHARGERLVMRALRLAAVRFIPTRVGNATSAPLPRSGRSVHPHARGERCRATSHAFACVGSSPRAWGTPMVADMDAADVRFIPTRVGNATTTFGSLYSLTVHPHARGERSSITTRPPSGVGSSPRAWGTHFLHLIVKQRLF